MFLTFVPVPIFFNSSSKGTGNPYFDIFMVVFLTIFIMFLYRLLVKMITRE